MTIRLRRGLHAKAAAVAAILAVPATGLAVDRAAHRPPPATPPIASPGLPEVDRVEPAPRPAPQGRAELRRELGVQGILHADARTEQPRLVARGDAALTGPSRAPAGDVGLDWLSDNAAALGLDPGDLETLEPVRRLRWNGLRHATFEQRVDGLPVEGGGLAATVDEDGRLIALAGSPAPDVEGASPGAPRVGAAAAVERVGGARPPVRSQSGGPERETTFAGGDRASLALVQDGTRVRLAWRVLADAGDRGLLDGLVDARDGTLLARRNLVRRAGGLAHDNYPGAPLGGTVSMRTYRTTGNDQWLTPPYDRLEGDIAHVYPDFDALDDPPGPPFIDPPAPEDEIGPSSGVGLGATWAYTQQRFAPTDSKMRCPPHPVFGCSWDNFTKPFSFEVNLAQAAAQAFWFVNRFHDHLEQDPAIGFSDALGNFEASSDGGGIAGDVLHVQVANGADTHPTDDGFPDGPHTNAASMATRPDGQSPRMQLGLFSGFGASELVNDVNSADDAAIVYHEYAHGLSDRLITDSFGDSVLTGAQGDAMAEGWSDWYALDFLESEGALDDSPAPDLRLGVYENLALRTQPLDCPPNGGGAECPGDGDAGAGGYTYGDLGRIAPVDEFDNETGEPGPDGEPDGDPHADGEIWAATLWDLRAAMVGAHHGAGVGKARELVTGAMLSFTGSGVSPDFLEMRDAMIAVSDDPDDDARISAVFAARGMGDDAEDVGYRHTVPDEDFTPGIPLSGPDGDGDATVDADDNCDDVYNPDQANADGDDEGDSCDAHDDADGVVDAEDNCPTTSNDDQADGDADGLGDACDADDDSDGLADVSDNCPSAFNPDQADQDRDGPGDACDPPLNTGPGPGPPGGGDEGDDSGGDDGGDRRRRPRRASFRGAPRRVRASRSGRFSYRFRAGSGLRAVAALRSRRPRLAIARRSLTVPRSGRVRLRFRLSRRQLRILRRERKLTLTLSVKLTNGDALSRTASTRFALLAPRRR